MQTASRFDFEVFFCHGRKLASVITSKFGNLQKMGGGGVTEEE
jgi:hypothetical protein